ncbi:MAG: hypothetical protein JRN15_12365, partial [Nitrososphaerota archaeon]|nr:hypothetical protein [Nitrososphaerota archaeon]
MKSILSMAVKTKDEHVAFKYFESKAAEISLSRIVKKKRAELLSKPVNQLDLDKIESVRDLVTAWSGTSIQSRSIAECAAV